MPDPVKGQLGRRGQGCEELRRRWVLGLRLCLRWVLGSVSPPNSGGATNAHSNHNARRYKHGSLHCAAHGRRLQLVGLQGFLQPAPCPARVAAAAASGADSTTSGLTRSSLCAANTCFRHAGTSAAISAFIDPSLNWADIEWCVAVRCCALCVVVRCCALLCAVRCALLCVPEEGQTNLLPSAVTVAAAGAPLRHTHRGGHRRVKRTVPPGMKVVLKGIQTGIDAVLAVRAGVDGIVVSNHGGRQVPLPDEPGGAPCLRSGSNSSSLSHPVRGSRSTLLGLGSRSFRR